MTTPRLASECAEEGGTQRSEDVFEELFTQMSRQEGMGGVAELRVTVFVEQEQERASVRGPFLPELLQTSS